MHRIQIVAADSTAKMYYTHRYQGLDSAPKRPKPQGTEKYMKGSLYSLRVGLFFQFVSVAGLISSYILGGGGIFNYALTGSTDEIRSCGVFRVAAATFAFIYVLGTVYISCFQLLMSDDAAFPRGFRSGSKLISYATAMDLCSSVLQFILFLHLATKYSPPVWEQFSQGGSEWLLTAFARLLHAIAASLYANGFFLVEAYHDEGTSVPLGIAIFVAYIASAVIEVASFAFPTLLFAPIVSAASILLALVWALAFENEVNQSAPRFHEPELTNEIEQQVNQYAILSPNAAY